VRYFNGFEPTASRELGTAAIVDGTLRGEKVALVLALDQERTFGSA
jgi:hypothetical protein